MNTFTEFFIFLTSLAIGYWIGCGSTKEALKCDERNYIIRKLVGYSYNRKIKKRGSCISGLESDNEYTEIINDFLVCLRKDWKLDEDSNRPEKAKEADEKLYRKIQEYFYSTRY